LTQPRPFGWILQEGCDRCGHRGKEKIAAKEKIGKGGPKGNAGFNVGPASARRTRRSASLQGKARGGPRSLVAGSESRNPLEGHGPSWPRGMICHPVEGQALSWPQKQHGRDGARPSMGKPLVGRGPSWPLEMEGHALSWPQKQHGRDGARPSRGAGEGARDGARPSACCRSGAWRIRAEQTSSAPRRTPSSRTGRALPPVREQWGPCRRNRVSILAGGKSPQHLPGPGAVWK